jgi:hypothetical protein
MTLQYFKIPVTVDKEKVVFVEDYNATGRYDLETTRGVTQTEIREGQFGYEIEGTETQLKQDSELGVGRYYYDFIRINAGKFFSDSGFGLGRAPNPFAALHGTNADYSESSQGKLEFNISLDQGKFPFEIEILKESSTFESLSLGLGSKVSADTASLWGQKHEKINIFPINPDLHFGGTKNVFNDSNDFQKAYLNQKNKDSDLDGPDNYEIEKLNIFPAMSGHGLVPGGRPINDGLGALAPDDLKPLKYFRDFSTQYDVPYLKSSISTDLRKLKYVNVESEYNYRVEEYERAIPTMAIHGPGADLNKFYMPERVLPNMYIHLALNESRKGGVSMGQVLGRELVDRSYLKHISLTQNLQNPMANIELFKMKGDYFKNWGKTINKVAVGAGLIGKEPEFEKLTENPVGSTAREFSNVVFPLKTVKQLSDVETYKETFPMQNTVEFSTDTMTQFADLLEQHGLKNALLKSVMAVSTMPLEQAATPGTLDEAQESISSTLGPDDEPLYDTGLSQATTMEETEEVYNYEEEQEQLRNILKPNFLFDTLNRIKEKRLLLHDFDTSVEQTQNKIFTKRNKVLCLDKWFKAEVFNFWTQYPLTNGDLESRTIELGGDDSFKNDDISNPFINKIYGLGFKAQINNLVKNRSRTYKDIISGKRAHSETVFYRVEKLDETGRVVQNFWFTNSSEIDVIKFVDTQVLYGKKYKYNIYAWQLVVATKYRYLAPADKADNEMGVGPTNTGGQDTGVDVFVVTEPELLLFETDYHISRDFTIIQDRPPVPPGVDMVPYRNVDNKILIALQAEVGEYTAIPELSMFFGNRLSEETGGELGRVFDYVKTLYPDLTYDNFVKNPPPIVFKSDDLVTRFEVFRIDRRPESYSDFLGKSIASLRADCRSTFIDDIEPNRKYYYTFRTQDIHGHRSNPTAVYELEMVKNSEVSYPVIRIIDFLEMKKKNEQAGRQSEKQFKKYLYIKPAVTHLLFNDDKSVFDETTPGGGKKRIDSAYDTVPVLGLENQSSLNKSFKFRITSKKTGRKLDLNVTFKEKLNLEKTSDDLTKKC